MDDRVRKKGVGKFMGSYFPEVGLELGFKASFFNLVYVSNEASVKLWKSLDYKETGRVPAAGRLKEEEGMVDALQFYCDFEEFRKKQARY